MIAKLEKKKAEADATKKIYGDKELVKTNSKKTDRSDEIKDLPPMIQSSSRRIAPIGGSELHHPSDAETSLQSRAEDIVKLMIAMRLIMKTMIKMITKTMKKMITKTTIMKLMITMKMIMKMMIETTLMKMIAMTTLMKMIAMTMSMKKMIAKTTIMQKITKTMSSTTCTRTRKICRTMGSTI